MGLREALESEGWFLSPRLIDAGLGWDVDHPGRARRMHRRLRAPARRSSTHRSKLPTEAIAPLARSRPVVDLLGQPGDVIWMSPLLMHGSRRSTAAHPRRVLHPEYAVPPYPRPCGGFDGPRQTDEGSSTEVVEGTWAALQLPANERVAAPAHGLQIRRSQVRVLGGQPTRRVPNFLAPDSPPKDIPAPQVVSKL